MASTKPHTIRYKTKNPQRPARAKILAPLQTLRVLLIRRYYKLTFFDGILIDAGFSQSGQQGVGVFFLIQCLAQ